MIEYTVGVPGSGKTYRAAYALYSNFGLDDKLKDKKFILNDVKFAITNLNEIKLENFQSGSIKKLDWDLFYDSLTTLHALYKDKNTDNELLIKAKELELCECLIILDECHNFLEKNDVVLVWWLSYHRHLHHQIYLITQNLSLVHSKYKSFSEFFYRAKPSSLKLFKSSMVYFQYTSSRLSLISKSGVVKIPFNKIIFDSYHSGANQQSQNLIKKYLVISVILISLLISVLFGIKSYFTKDVEVVPVETPPDEYIPVHLRDKNNEVLPPVINSNDSDKLFIFNCFSSLCYHKLSSSNNFIIPFAILNVYLKEIDEKYIFYELKGNRSTLYVMASDEKFKFINNGVKNETNEKNPTLPNLIPSFGK
jgi:zona occludens toxin